MVTWEFNFNTLFLPRQKIRKQLAALITRVQQLGLAATDVATVQEYLEYNEYGLCLGHIVTQLYEYEIPIDNEFYHEVEKVAALMSFPEKEYNYIKELITM